MFLTPQPSPEQNAMRPEQPRQPSFSGVFEAGTGKQYNIGHVSGEHVHLGTDTHLLSHLPYAKGAAFNSREREHEPFCLDGTRVDILKTIAEWADTPTKSILWLNGWAGTGKSTIARTVAREFDTQSRLAASFFFSGVDEQNGGGAGQEADFFVTTVACQLANMDPGLKMKIEDVVRRYPLITTQTLSAQWRRLVLGPLVGFLEGYDGRPMVVVVDALDLGPEEKDVGLIVRLLGGISDASEGRVLVLLVARPDASVREAIGCVNHREVRLQDVPKAVIDADISLFVADEFEKIPKHVKKEIDWPWVMNISGIVADANGIFIWAEIACQHIRRARHRDIAADRKSKPQRELDRIYADVFNRSISREWDESQRVKHCSSVRSILGAIFLLQVPVSAGALSSFLRREDVESVLENFHSILDIPTDPIQVIRLHHPSLRKYLFDKERCGSSYFLVEEDYHRRLVQKCLTVMSEGLNEPQWAIPLPLGDQGKEGTEREMLHIPLELQYASCYWVYHAQHGKKKLLKEEKIGEMVNRFLQKYMLKWLSLLHVMGKVSMCVKMIERFESIVVGQSPVVTCLLDEARQFQSDHGSA
ncbi:hypothetical protein BO71DRAFT_435338 [Aspergillus ellipticus CBS 707.79]|uniref:Nephrocystin 3-like N-terminal domain-containing protein n=1 Tax=Aspergillus ellipticus CBS 707.79 TaxID=1448320 RepID=A0A319CUF5_9EURO|nr:hypothetical protein BO71DRAFT_435338 [Aspergillus ellipticus CBS 707.79]